MAVSDPTARVTYALSSAQRRLWFMSRWAEHDPQYNVTLVWQISFRIDVSALRAAIHELVARHEILRTRYPVVDGVPRQEVDPPEAWELSCVDEALANGDDRDEVIAQFAARVARTPLDLERGPVFAATLLRVAYDDYVLAAVLHHLAIDQWSINILTEELEALYAARAEARSPDLPPTVPYREYAAWEVAQLACHEDRLRRYWEHQLADCPPLLTPPYDRDQQSRRALSGREYRFAIDADNAERLRRRAREQRASMFAMTFGLYASLLARWTGSERMTIGTTVAFRHPRFRHTVGCFVNPLAIMLDLRERTRFDSVLGHVAEQVFGGLSHAQYPFDLLVQRVRALHPGHTGELVTAYMQFQPLMLSPAEREGQRFRVDLSVHNGRAKFPLMLNMSQRRTGLDCTFEYDSDRFSEARIRALADDYVDLLTVASADPTRLVRRVALQADRRRPDRSTDAGFTMPPPAGSAARSRSSLSARLADIWSELLLVDSVPPESDFFALGGHSLLLATLAWRIKQEFQAHLRVGDLYDASQFEDMVALIADAPLRSDLAVFQSAVSVERVGGIPCQLELGTWTREALDQLFASAAGLKDGQRMRHFATALVGTPFQFESLRPLPLPGRLPVRLGALDSITFVYTSLAMAAGRDFEEFVKWLYRVRYAQAGDRGIDSHPESGNIFDFAEGVPAGQCRGARPAPRRDRGGCGQSRRH